MKFFVGTLILGVSLAFSSLAHGSIALTQADFTSMTIFDSDGLSGANTSVVAASIYADGQVDMTGIAGATGNLNGNPGQNMSGAAFVYYEFADISAFTDGAQFTVISHNDNNQDWEIGLWVSLDGANTIDFGSSIAAGSSDVQSVILGAGVTNAGVYVVNILSPDAADDYHASWTVPEPTSLLIWGSLAIAGVTIRRRRSS